jgi:mRNA interferase RelE/StbE
MKSYRVAYTPTSAKELEHLSKKNRQRVIEAVHGLADNPRPMGCKKLKGRGDFYRIRVGDYRVVYNVFDDVVTVLVVRVRHRRDAY